MKTLHLAALSATLCASLPALANTNLVLDFEGVDSFAPVGNFYPGISFSDAALGLKNDVLNTYFSHAPTPGTVMFATDSSAVMNVAKGIANGISFYYSATSSAPDVVTVYSGLNGTGTALASISLTQNAQSNGCSDSTFCNWQSVSLNFKGIAQSVNFGGNATNVGFDNVAITAVPEPASVVLMALGGATLLLGARRRQQA